MINSKAYAAQSASSPLAAFEIQHRDPGPEDVQIEILYCGVCHSDLHTVRNEWHNTLYPSIPGHEIVGRVVLAVGNRVQGYKVGDLAGVSCMVDSCGHCSSCDEEEQYCKNGFTGTYNGPLFGGENTHAV